MKKLLSIAIALILSAGLMAQEEEESNRFWLGGGFGVGTLSFAGEWDISPSFGLMFGERFGAGIDVGFGDNNYWMISPYARYYLPVTDKFAFYGDAFLEFSDAVSFGFGARAGAQFWFTPKWSMAASTGLLAIESDGNTTDFGLGADLSLALFSMFFHF